MRRTILLALLLFVLLGSAAAFAWAVVGHWTSTALASPPGDSIANPDSGSVSVGVDAAVSSEASYSPRTKHSLLPHDGRMCDGGDGSMDSGY